MLIKCSLPLLVLAAGCLDEPLGVDETSQEVVSANGVSLNGVSLNGVSLNGVSLNGVSLNGVSLNGVSLNGVSLNGVSLNGVSLNGTTLDGTSVTADATGAVFTATLSNGANLPLRVDGVTQLTGSNSDLYAYTISYLADLGWSPLCGGASALVVAGTWDTRAGVPGGGAYSPSTTLVTFACRGTSVAKCVEMGYRPTTHADHMQSCVRLLRGDYCGDGQPYTVTGNRVNIYDRLGIQADTEAWEIEAEWSPNGARCISGYQETRFAAERIVPSCFGGTLRTVATCGRRGWNGVFLVSETPTVLNGLTSTLTSTLSL